MGKKEAAAAAIFVALVSSNIFALINGGTFDFTNNPIGGYTYRVATDASRGKDVLEIYSGSTLELSFDIGTKKTEYIMAHLMNSITPFSYFVNSGASYAKMKLGIAKESTGGNAEGILFSYIYDPITWNFQTIPTTETAGNIYNKSGYISGVYYITEESSNKDYMVLDVAQISGVANVYQIYFEIKDSDLKMDYIVGQLVQLKPVCASGCNLASRPYITVEYTISTDRAKRLGTAIRFPGTN